MESLKESCSNYEDEQEIGEKFLLLTKTINTFPVDEELAHSYIDLFVVLPQREQYLKEFLNAKILSQEKQLSKLVEIVL